jgi:hypothetical protein
MLMSAMRCSRQPIPKNKEAKAYDVKKTEKNCNNCARIRHKYESHAIENIVYKQIEQALEKIDSSSNPNQEKIKAILKRYAMNKICLDEAYYDLLEDGLIPMPQRCGMSVKIPVTKEDEERLKEKIKTALPD